MNVAHVKENYVKSKRQEDFWYAQMKALMESSYESWDIYVSRSTE